ncbi:MAG: recombinase family protein [Patescibacteria group bacterium]|nr:recombinase family protein [Patescibacteria group bacterium]MCL5409877.1 recombinase family protein [Patescibacteria group bacterium]
MDATNPTAKIEYCLYARKSSEDDERQAMSIDSQIKEMNDLAIKDGLFIKEIRRESHSAKISGQRPVFNQLLNDIKVGLFTGILTWAPDRLSRNAGDLGMLVDLMDQGKLQQIKTFSQSFSNNPNEKFLLMILCSQAKLENDQKGINVKRGIRAKCEMGWRPGPPPIGYFNRSFAGVKDIVIDPDRGYVITEMFKRVGLGGQSGRDIKKWFDNTGFTTRSGAKVTLSSIYLMLKNPFYYGEFEYPVKSGTWYKGAYQPLTTKELFNKVQHKLIIPFAKAKWGSKEFTFKNLLICGSCGASFTAEDKYRKRKIGDPKYHVYYHCSRKRDPECPEPYVTEEKLTKELVKYINFTAMAHPQMIHYTEKLKFSMEQYKKMRDQVLLQQDIDPDKTSFDIREYAKHVLHYGTTPEKREIIKALGGVVYIHNQLVCSAPSK